MNDMNERNAPPPGPRRAALARHRRVCAICSHPQREAIEEALLHWQELTQIQRRFKLRGRNALYRHAHAAGLFDQRTRNTRFALGAIIERAHCVKPTAGDIIRAVQVYTLIDAHGQPIDPPRRVIRSSTTGQPPLPGTHER